MSIDTLYGDGIEQNLQRMAANPGPAPEPGFSATSLIGDTVKAFPDAAFERAGFWSDVLSGFGNNLAATGGSAGGMFSVPTEAEQKQEAEARDRMLKDDSFNVAAGNVLRKKAEEFAPDPLTSHWSNMAIHGLVRFGAKAMTDVGTMGPYGAIITGLDEGDTTTQNLRTKGIDTATATKIGAVTGTISALGAVMPIGGRAGLETIGLIAVGGPGSYMTQEHLSRKILENAGYNDEASLHNPFDPLGLALSTVIPGAFGALHMRGVYKRAGDVAAGRVPLQGLQPDELRSLKYNDTRLDDFARTTGEKYGVPPELLVAIKNAGEKSGPTAIGPETKYGRAQGVMQFLEGTANDLGLKDRTDPVASIDASGRYMRQLFDKYGSWDAAVAHYNGGWRQGEAVKNTGSATFNETKGYLDRVRAYMADHTAEAAAKKPENVDAARVAVLNDTVAKSLPDTPDAHAQMLRATDVVAESGGRAAEQMIPPVHQTELPQFREWFGNSKVVDEQGRPAVMYHGTGNDVAAFETGRPGPHADLNAVFLTADPSVASHYAQVGSMFGDKTPNVAPVYVNARNPFDYENAAHRAALVDRVFETTPKFEQGDGQQALILDGKHTVYTKSVLDAGLAEGRNWELIERKNFQQAIKDGGHDGFYVKEDTKNLAVFNPEQVKSAIGNSGKFDPNSASLTDPLKPGESPIRWQDATNALPAHDSVKLAGDEPAKPGAEVGTLDAMTAPKSKPAGEAATGEQASVDTLLAQKLATEQPDLKVVLPGSEEHITVGEAMARIAEEQKRDGQWADLVKVAVECALGA